MRKCLVFAACAAILLGMATGVLAEAYKPWVKIVAENDQGVAEWYWDWADQQASWEYTLEDYVLSNGAVIKNLVVGLDEDPAVSLRFDVAAGSSNTVFRILGPGPATPSGSDPGPLPVGITNPLTRASASLTVTDTGSNGATATGLFGGKVYQARYNDDTGTFASLVDTLSITSPTMSGTLSEQLPGSGYQVVSGYVSNMRAEYYFSLTANDEASGTSYYEMISVPESSSIMLAFTVGLPALGAFAARRRRV